MDATCPPRSVLEIDWEDDVVRAIPDLVGKVAGVEILAVIGEV